MCYMNVIGCLYCMNVIKYKNKQKEWHTATKPFMVGRGVELETMPLNASWSKLQEKKECIGFLLPLWYWPSFYLRSSTTYTNCSIYTNVHLIRTMVSLCTPKLHLNEYCMLCCVVKNTASILKYFSACL